MMLLLEKLHEGVDALYCNLKVFEPAVRPVIRYVELDWIAAVP